MTSLNQPINLPGRMLTAWRDTVLEFAKLPRGTRREGQTPEAILGQVLRQETGTIIDLWEAFTKERQEVSRGMLGSQQLTVAYLLGFHLVNAARTRLLLRRLQDRTDFAGYLKHFASKTEVTWYDLGCGTGAVAHAVVDYLLGAGLPPSALNIHLYDTSSSLLAAASRLLAQAGCGAKVKTHRVGLERLDAAMIPTAKSHAIHGISLGYVWNELARNAPARTRIMRLVTEQAQGNTLLLVLEPASQTFARAAMDLRDQLTELGYQPLYPCLASTPCPMLKLSRDWCYSEGTWQQPKIMQTLDKSIGISRSHLSGTLLAFASKSLAKQLKLTVPEAVVVGRPERSNLAIAGARTPNAKRAAPPSKPNKPKFDYLLCRGDKLAKEAPTPNLEFLPRGIAWSASENDSGDGPGEAN